jgi:DUF2934 family protein
MKVSTKPRKFQAALVGSERQTARSGSSAQVEESSTDSVYFRIAELAYQLYEQRGRKDGHDIEDWIQAEQTIRAEKS